MIADEVKDQLDISIHTSREGGDILPKALRPRQRVFQSTPPAREVTLRFLSGELWFPYFNPHLPRGR